MDCQGCGFFLSHPNPSQHNLCSKCYRAQLGAASAPPAAAAAATATPPLQGGVLSLRTLHQMGEAATAAAAAHDLRTMLCGWFTMAASTLLAQRLAAHAGGPPPRLTRASLAALCAELASPAALLPHLHAALQGVAEARRAYAALHAATFVAPNTDPAAGAIVSPMDERTLRGHLGAECSLVDLAAWLRAQPQASPQARAVALLRPIMARFAPASHSAAAAMGLHHAACLEESVVVLQGFAGAGGGAAAAAAAAPAAPYIPRKLFSSEAAAWEAGWFVEVHPSSPCATAGAAAATALPARPDVALPAGAAVPLLPTTPTLPWLFMLDAAQLNGHFNAAFCFTLVEGEGEGGVRKEATHLRPGFYCAVVESLHSKCRAHWKYAEVLLELQACVYGSWFGGSVGGSAGSPPPPPSLRFACEPCGFDACGQCWHAAAQGAAAALQALHPHALVPMAVGGPRDPLRACDVCGQRLGAGPGAAAAAGAAGAAPVACCATPAGDACAGPIEVLGGHVVHLHAAAQHPRSAGPGF